jgi:CO/xanthine dehydrogenase FAD-binding subunit
MKPARFEYYDPATKEEVFGLLEEFGDDAKLLAGGQSLLPMMNFRVARPKCLIDINRIANLAFIREENDHIVMGSLTRERWIEESDEIRRRLPILAEATSYIGHIPIRNKGTIGGSIAHADPSAEYPLMMKLLEGQAKLESSNGSRWIDSDDFFVDYLTTDLRTNEMITEVKFPIPSSRSGFSFQELNRRHGDFAIVAVGVVLSAGVDGVCDVVRIGLGGVGPVPFRALRAESMLVGERLDRMDATLIQMAATNCSEDADPTSDIHASAEYRREMSKVIAHRALVQAVGRCKEKLLCN